MKGYKKALVASLATVGVSCALIGGATFALFSSGSTTDIAVNSGKVKVTATVGNPTLYTNLYSDITPMDSTTWTNGGEVKVDGVEVTIDNITPGDGVKLPITIHNDSSVKVKYQVRLSSIDVYEDEAPAHSLLDVLDVSVDSSDLEMATVGSTLMTNWAPLAVGSDDITLNLDIYLPEEVEDEVYQGLTCKYTLGVYAVQGNAQTSGLVVEGNTYYVTEADSLAEVRDLINSGMNFAGKTIKLAADVKLDDKVWTPIGSKEDKIYFNGTFDGGEHTITVGNIEPMNDKDDYTALFGAVKDATIKNLIVAGSVAGQNIAGIAARVEGNTTFENCTNKATVSGTIKTGGIACAVVVDAGNTVQFINCTNEGNINGVHDGTGGIAGYVSGAGAVKISKCTNSGDINASQMYAGAAVGYVLAGNSKGYVDLTNTGRITPNTHTDSSGRYLWDEETQTLLCGYVGTPGNWTLPVKVSSPEQLGSVLEAAQDGATIALSEGTYQLSSAAQNKELTIVGVEGTVIEVSNPSSPAYPDYSIQGSNVTFENVTIKTNNVTYTGYAAVAKATYNKCTIDGYFCLYGESEFNDCTFNVSGDTYNVWTWGASKVTFDGCTFNSDGKALMLYSTVDTELIVNNCVFNDSGVLSDLKAAIEIGNDYKVSYILRVNNTVVNGYEITDKGIPTNSTLWGNKNSMDEDHLHVYIDGELVYGNN